MPTAKITSKGQMVIPKPIREKLGLKKGDKLDFMIMEGGEIVVRPAVHDVRELKGLLYRKGQSAVTVEEMNRTIRRRGRRI